MYRPELLVVSTGGGVTINIDQLYVSSRDAQTGWIHDLSRDSRSFELCQSRMYKTGNEQEKEEGWFPTTPLGRRSIGSYSSTDVCRAAATFSSIKKSLWQQIAERGGGSIAGRLSYDKSCSRVVRLFAQEGKQYSSPTRFPYCLP